MLTTRFAGYARPNYTMVPDELFDEQLPALTGAELKALLYIIRRTFGWKKESDNISLNQLLRGITMRTGERLDHGTGLSRSSLVAALKGLAAKNLIIMEQRSSLERGNEATNYRLNVLYHPSSKIERGESDNRTSLVRKPDQQETADQETARQLRISKENLGAHVKEGAQGSEERNQPYQTSSDPVAPSRIRSSPRQVHGLTSIADALVRTHVHVLAQRQVDLSRQMNRPDETHLATEQLVACVEEISDGLGDSRHQRSNLTQAKRLLHVSKLSESAFVARLYEAYAVTRDRRDHPQDSPQVARPMAYFWRIVRDQLGAQAVSVQAAIVPDAPGLVIRRGRGEELPNDQSDGG